jgi:tRNA-uridine 2-sulfurtransferase
VKVVVAMSGGVDSSVAAALVKEKGYEVIGVTMRLWPGAGQANEGSGPGNCCGSEAIEDARKVAFKLGMPHYVMDFSDIFESEIISDFCREYRQGRTPNPCVLCNRYIKFGILLDKARELGADYLATGHYARTEQNKTTGKYLLKKGSDSSKDQSYFLCQLRQEQLRQSLFPVGNLTKIKVRDIAGELKLPVAEKAESQEICFIPDDDYPRFLEEYLPGATTPGPIVDESGKTLGSHRGIAHYTIGQRKGLGIAAKEPLFVTRIESESNTIIVGDRKKIYDTELVASNMNWIALDRPESSVKLKARIRYRHPEAEAMVTPLENHDVYVKFSEPQMAITPGQTIAFYDGDTVACGGTIIRQGS